MFFLFRASHQVLGLSSRSLLHSKSNYSYQQAFERETWMRGKQFDYQPFLNMLIFGQSLLKLLYTHSQDLKKLPNRLCRLVGDSDWMYPHRGSKLYTDSKKRASGPRSWQIIERERPNASRRKICIFGFFEKKVFARSPIRRTCCIDSTAPLHP